MQVKKIILIQFFFFYAISLMAQDMTYQDYSLSLEERVTRLVSAMTLEEKIGQMSYEAPAIERLGVPEYNW